MVAIPVYRDSGRDYLELHALFAPIRRAGYYEGLTEADVERETQEAREDFEGRHGVALIFLGRSGRHVCIVDTAANRARYWNLARAALAAVKRLFDSWKDENIAKRPAPEPELPEANTHPLTVNVPDKGPWRGHVVVVWTGPVQSAILTPKGGQELAELILEATRKAEEVS